MLIFRYIGKIPSFLYKKDYLCRQKDEKCQKISDIRTPAVIHYLSGIPDRVYSRPYSKRGNDRTLPPYRLNHTSNGTPVEHEHTYAEFQLLHQLSVIEIAGAALVFFLLAALLAATQTLLYHPVYPDYLLPVTGKLSLRAPPVA